MKAGERSGVDCFKCKHFYVTWEKGRPRGCRALNFKTKRMPSDVVCATSGKDCLLFTLKHREHVG
ncbi:hypothetical protein MNBD_DELTA02-982 [hydrothermal vent metagenome]|uniref:Uracil-DNA glycosylase n=1 Tax=hydrothermal vent metagenome TaxID=652676 RepID=A0A3B0VY99_9ZZZZ